MSESKAIQAGDEKDKAARQQVTERAIKELVERVWHGKSESTENKEQHSANQGPK